MVSNYDNHNGTYQMSYRMRKMTVQHHLHLHICAHDACELIVRIMHGMLSIIFDGYGVCYIANTHDSKREKNIEKAKIGVDLAVSPES